MLRLLLDKIKEALISVLPITLIVLILALTPLVNLTVYEAAVFFGSAVFLILGIGLFNLGADMAMSPIGEQIGSSLMKSKNILLILLICFVMGFLITVAEPDLTVLAHQVSSVLNDTFLIIFVGFGVGLFLVIAVLKIIFKKDLSSILMFMYMALFSFALMMVIKGNGAFLPLAFDSGGVTTGPITVPFIMALGVGIATTLGGRNSKENSFGLVALCSVGPILAVLILGLSINGDLTYDLIDYSITNDLLATIGKTLLSVSKEIIIALGLIVLFFLIINFIFIKLSKKKLMQIGIGILYTFFGLLFFLAAANIGFLPIGYKLGLELSSNKAALIILGFVLGFVVVLAEPAVHVLTKQVEEITTGGVSKKSMLLALCFGVGISILLSVIRIIFKFSIMYYLIPGYLISLGLSFFVPKIYTAIAFDSGGVASGPLTSTFILPFAVGACMNYGGAMVVLENAFGVVAMVAMTPLITIQLLGFKAQVGKNVKKKIRMNRLHDASDEEIIYFN